MRRTLLAVFVFVVSILAGYIAAASTTTSDPAYADTSKEYGVGYEAILQYGGQNITVARANASLDAGPRVIAQPPPETVTQTQTQTYTTTITKTITLPNGETTTVVTEVRTVTMPQQGPRKAVLVGLGLVALMLLLLARR